MGPVHNANMAAGVVKFGDGLELDRITYELRRSGRALKLERIPMEILFLLVERRGQLVSRDDIIPQVWGKDVFLDTDNSINSAIRADHLSQDEFAGCLPDRSGDMRALRHIGLITSS